jgi:hypothetical protein
MRFQVTLLASGLAGCGAIMLCSCGSSSPPKEPSAAQLQSSMQAAIQQANSVHVNGTATGSKAPVGINIGLNRAGDLAGTVTESGATLQLTSVDRKVYVKANQAFLHQYNVPASACSTFCGHWIELPASSASQFNQVSMKNLTGVPSNVKLTKAGSTTVNGQSAWVLKAPDGTVIDVASTGKPYPIRVKSPTQRGMLNYSQWNSVPKPTAPPANQVINLSGLK